MKTMPRCATQVLAILLMSILWYTADKCNIRLASNMVNWKTLKSPFVINTHVWAWITVCGTIYAVYEFNKAKFGLTFSSSKGISIKLIFFQVR